MFFSKPKLQHMNPYMEPTEPEDPASSLDVLQAYGSEAWRRFNMGSGTINLGEAYQDYIDKAEKLTGKKLRNPEYYGVDADPEIRQKYWSDWNQYREDGGQLSGSVYRRMWQEREFRRQIDDFVKAHPDLKDQLTPPDQSFESQGRQKATDASEAAQETWMRSRQGWLDYAASTAGSFGGAMGDPINIMTMPFGFGGVGTGVKGIWTGFLKAGIANATVEGMVQPIVKGYNNQLGTPYGWGDVGISLGSAFLLGGGVDAGFRQAYRSLAGRFGYVPIKNSDGYVVAWRRKVPSLGGTPSLEAELRPLSEIPTDLMQRAQQGDPAAIADIASRLTEAQKATGETVIPHTTMQQAAEGDMGALRQVAEPEAKTDPVVKMMLDAAEADERLLVAPDPKIPEADHAATMAQTLRHIDEPDLEPLPVRTETVDVAPEIVPKLEAEIRELRAKAETPDAETQARIDELEAQIRQIDTFGRDPVQDAMMIREGAFQITNDVDLGNPGVRQARSLAALSDEAFAQVTKGEAAPELGALVADHAVPELHGRLLSDLTARQPVSLDDAKAQLVEILGSPDYRPHVEDVQGPVAQSAKSPRQLDDPTGPEAKAQVQRLEQELREELAAGGREPPPMEQILADPQAREVLISRADEVRTAIAQMADIVPPGTEVRVFDSIDMLPTNIRASVRAANGKAFAAAVDAFQGAKSVAERHKARQALDAASRQQGVEGIANDGVIWIASYAMNPQGRIAHEVVHALRTSGRISPDEVRVLATAARDLDVFHSDLEAMYRADLEGRVANVDAILEEEAAAHMIDAVVRGEVPAGRVVEPQVASLVDRIKEFFAKVRSALTGRGFVSPETVPVRRPEQDVIATLLSGEMAKREARADWMRDNVIKDWAQITESKVNGDGSVLLAMRHSDEKTGQSMRADLDRLGYFSGALEAAKRLRQNKGTPEQMLAMLQKEGAKKAEIEATGLAEFIKNKAAGPEPSGASTQGRSNGGDLIADIASGKVSYQAKFFKEDYSNLGGVSNAVTDEIEKVLKDNGIDARFSGQSGQSVSRYIEINDGDRSFKLRVSDHPDRHGSDYTVRIDGKAQEVYADAMTGERIGGADYRALDSADRDVYDWIGHAIDRSDYDAAVRDGLRAAADFISEGRTAGQRAANVSRNQITKSEIIKFLEDKVKQTVKEQGQPLFAMRGLDMSPEARKQRAEEMGFDTSRVLYHGTKQTFMRFAREKLGVNTGAASATKAFFFADNPRVASGYAMERGSMVLDGIQKKEAQDLVRRIAKLDGEIEDAAAVGDFDRADFLSAEREAIYSQIDEIERDGAQVVPVYLRMKNPLVVDYKGKSRGANTYASVLEKAQKDGHDGVIFKNTFDSMLHEDKPHDVYAVFDPTNIRSVNAAFDPSEAGSANLMFAMRDFDKDLADRAVKHFGLTRDASEAGYILPDGRMLDFTGRHYAGGVWNESIQAYRLKERDYLAGTRSVDHRELEDLTESGGTDGMHEFMRRSGAIRYQSHTGGFEAFYPPSEAQIRAILRSHSQRFRGEPLDIDVGDPATGEIIKSVSLERPTVRKVLEVFGGNKDDGVMFALRDLSRRLDAPLVDDLGKSDPHPGRVMAVHGTKAQPFDQFDPTKSADFGIHFGTRDQADIPAGYTTTRENARMIPVVLDLKTVVDVPDMMTWPPVEVAAAVEKAYPLARGLEDRVRAVIAAGSTETGPTGSVRPSREALDAGKAELRRLMTEAKIDGLRYWNDSEGEGWSYIVWDEGKVSSATSGEPMMGVKPDGNPEFAKPAAQPQPEQPRIQAPDIRSFADQIQALTQDMPMLTRADDGAVDSVRMGDQVYRVVRGEDGSVQGVTIDAEAPGAAQLDSAGLAAQITPRLMEIAQQYGIDADAVSSIASRVADDVANGTDLTDALTRQLQDALPDQAQASQPLYGMMDAKGRVKPGAQKRAEDLAADLAEIEAELKGANIDEREALQRKRASLLNAIAADKVLDDARAYRSARGEEDPAKGLMHLIESEGVHGGAMDVVTLKNIIQGKALSMMDELVWEFRKGAFLGDVRRTANTAVRTRMENVIREAAGEKTGDPLAASMGKAWLEVAEYLRQRFNAAGGDIGKLKGWFAPQYHDVDALVKAGRQVWVDYMMKDGVLDWERMTKSDGSQLTVAERRDLLRDIWRTITTDGAEKREVTGFAGKGAMYKRHADHRVLHFKNADAYLKYTKEFGSGDVYAMMMGHVNVMSRDIAAMERFGANPDVVLERVRQQLRIDAELAQTPRSMFDDLTDLVAEIKEFKSDAIKTRVDATLTNLSKAYDKLDRIKRKSALRGSVSQQQAKLIAEIANAHMALNDLMVTGDMQPRALVLAERIVAMQDQMLETATRYSVKSKDPVERANTYLRRGEEMWKLYKGSTNVPGNSRAADAMQGFRNWTSASILVKASISAISDQAIGMAARAFIGMPVHKQLTSFIKGFSKADRKAALRFRVGLDQAMTAASVQSRYAGYVNTRSVTGYIADRTHAFSGLSPMTQAAKVGFSSDFMAWMAELAATTPYQKLDRWIQQMLERHRISADDWAALRTVTPDMDRGVAKLSSEAIERDVGEDLAERYMAALFRERAMAVIDPTLRGRTAFISETKPGTVIGEMLRSVAMVKSFPTSYATLVLGRLYNQIASGRGMDTNSIAYGTAILFLGMAFGGLAIQLKDITSGADPQDMTEPEFWAKAFMQSGGAGIFGDFIMNSANRHGNGLATTIMGPMADRGSQILDATVGNVLLYAQDEKTSFGRKATGLMRSMTPGAFVPFYLRAAYERAVIDGIQKQIDPDSYRSFRSRIRSKKKFSGNEYFWPPGSPMPERGLRLYRAFGGDGIQ